MKNDGSQIVQDQYNTGRKEMQHGNKENRFN